MTAMSGQPHLAMQMHEMTTYLNQQGVVTILVLAQHGMIGRTETPVDDLTMFSDTVVLLRFFEAGGRVRRALSVLKKRTGAHEDSIREFRIDTQGLRVGNVLTEFRGVLPAYPPSRATAPNSSATGPPRRSRPRTALRTPMAQPDPVALILAPGGGMPGSPPRSWRRSASPRGSRTAFPTSCGISTRRPAWWSPRKPCCAPIGGRSRSGPSASRPGRTCPSSCSTTAGASPDERLTRLLGNVTLLERPFHPAVLAMPCARPCVRVGGSGRWPPTWKSASGRMSARPC